MTRLEDRSQARRCLQLRRATFSCLTHLIPRSQEAYAKLRSLAEPLCLDKYCDIYDISDADMREALLGYSEKDFEDIDSLKVLKILTSRFVTSRKMVLCCLLAFDANGDRDDFAKWETALDEIKDLSALAAHAGDRICSVLEQEECKLMSLQKFTSS